MVVSTTTVKVAAWFVDSWERVGGVEESPSSSSVTDSFAVFKICLRGMDGEEWCVRKRYSVLFSFHRKVVNGLLGLKMQDLAQLNALFPSKSFPFLRQTDLFLDSRARALDAYLQTLLHLLNSLQSNAIVWEAPDMREFFENPACKTSASTREPTKVSLATPKHKAIRKSETINSTDLNAIEELLKKSRQGESFAAELDLEMASLVQQLHLDRKFESVALQNHFYDLKREYELLRIKSGLGAPNYLKKSFECSKSQSKSTIAGSIREMSPKTDDYEQDVDGEVVHREQKTQLKQQEAILDELASTLKQQKELSKCLAEEVERHNTIITRLQENQEETISGFQKASGRVKRLQ